MSAPTAGRVAIVTGAAAGIGAACAELLAEDGYRVVALDLAEPGGAPAGVSWVEADVADERAWERVVFEIEREHGRLDGLVNAAGISDPADTIDDCTPAIWDRILSVNLDGAFLGCKHAVGAMRRLGTDDGSIVNVASVLGTTATGTTTAYSASMAGVRQLTKSVALFLARERLPIRCNSVHPDPPPRSGRARDVAEAVAFLMSPDASYVNGSDLVVDGGHLASGAARLGVDDRRGGPG